ncbi:ComEC/Rec2 family competence protein [Pedobacter immunditicola]|uniref:ComEC/Rec2 family competence protein n=1 Tax=Pedobacter immunditicola TaxID=3133440 RepID=UPI0030A38982
MSTRAETVFVNLLFPLMAGIFVAHQFPSKALQNGFAISIFLLMAILLVLNIGYIKFKAYRYKVILTNLVYLLIFCLGGWSLLLHTSNLQPDHFSKLKLDAISVILDEAPEWKGNQVRVKVRVNYGYREKQLIPTQGRLLLTITSGKMQPRMLNYGDELMLPASYVTIEGPQNPAEFDFKGWLANQNIGHQIYINHQSTLLTGRHRGRPLIAYALALRQRQIEKLAKLIHDQEAFAVASTLILGYRADLSKETLSAYSDTGTIHALSVSGMHVGIIYVVLTWLLSFLDRWKTAKLLKTLLIIGLIWFYALVTGFSPSALRSAIMLTCFILAKSWSRRSNSFNIMAFSAFVLLIDQPLLLFDVGFQLSYIAVVGLIYLQPLIYKQLYFRFNWADRLWQFTALSVAAQLATFPLSIYYFHQFPVHFLWSNLFILLPVTLMMYIGLGMLLFKLYVLAPVLEWIIKFTNAGLKWIAALPYSTVTAVWWDKTILILLISFLVLLILALKHRHKKLLFSALIVFLLLQSSLSSQQLKAYRQQKTIVFKLRKNYAIAHLESHQAVLYTDVDPASKVYLYSIKPCLDQHQIKAVQIKPVNFITVKKQ